MGIRHTLLLVLSSLAGIVKSQTVEIMAGGGFFDNSRPLETSILLDFGGIAFDSDQNLLIAESRNHRIRIWDRGTNEVRTLGGTGIDYFEGDGDIAINTSFDNPHDIVLDSDNNIYIASFNRIRRIDASTSVVTTFAGNGEASDGMTGNGGLAIEAAINPWAMAIDNTNDILYFIEGFNHVVRKINLESGIIEGFAGSGNQGFSGDGGPAINAEFNLILGIAVNSEHDVFISDTQNLRVRRINSADNTISTYAGSGIVGPIGDNGPAISASIEPGRISFDAQDNLIIPQLGRSTIRHVDKSTGIITTLAGTTPGYSGDGGLATLAQLNSPGKVITDDSGNLFLAEITNRVLRKVDSNQKISTVLGGEIGDGGRADQSIVNPNSNPQISLNGNIYFVETNHHRIRKIDPDGIISIVAGTGESGYSGDNGPATSAQLNFPENIQLNNEGNLLIADRQNHRIRLLNLETNIIQTVAGNGTPGFSGDGGPATGASLDLPTDMVVDNTGNIYIADASNHIIRFVNVDNGVISTYAGVPGNGSFEGDGGPVDDALLFKPTDLHYHQNLLYLSNADNRIIRKIDLKTDIIELVAGTGAGGDSGDGGLATNATFSWLTDLTTDKNGNLFIANGNGKIRYIDVTSGIVSTYAPAQSDLINFVSGIQFDPLGNLILTDMVEGRIVRINLIEQPSDTSPPTVVKFSPFDDETDVSLDPIFQIFFSEEIKKGPGSITLFGSDDQVIANISSSDITVDNTSLSFNLATNLIDEKSYYILIDQNAVMDIAGNNFEGITSSDSWNFRTADFRAPEIVKLEPLNGSIGVAINPSLTLELSEPIIVSGGIRVFDDGDNLILEIPLDQSNVVDNSIAIELTNTLDYSTGYYILIDEGVISDDSQNSFLGISEKDEWSFTTEEQDVINGISSGELILEIFPNPIKNVLNIKENGTSIKNFMLLDFSGNIIAEYRTESNSFQIDTSQLENGIYLLGVQIDDSLEYYKLLKK